MAKKFIGNRNRLHIPRGGGGGGYEPDDRTIGLTSNDTLAVKDYISATMVNSLIEQTKEWVDQNFCPEWFAVELDGRLETLEDDVIPNIEGSIEEILSELTFITPKVERALLTPINPPSAVEIVGIGTNGAQQRINIGSGLAIDNSTLHLANEIWEHNLNILSADLNTVANTRIYDTQSSDIGLDDLKARGTGAEQLCNGVAVVDGKNYQILYYMVVSHELQLAYLDDNRQIQTIIASRVDDSKRRIFPTTTNTKKQKRGIFSKLLKMFKR